MKCRRCGGAAVIDIRRHNTAFCGECFRHHCREQVRRAIDEHSMFTTGDRILVAVSGGKDSLAVWDLLRSLGYDADGLYLGLGIGDYSDESGRYAREFAASRDLLLHEVDLARDLGFDVPTAAAVTRRAPCGACGLSKRHLFNQIAIERGYDVVVTGHNLDDEAAVLLGNVVRWEAGYLARQYPVLPARPGFVRKTKPLVRLGEREMAAYCVLNGIDYQVEECPMAEGNRHIGLKNLLNELEHQSAGAKAAFLFGFYERGHEAFVAATANQLDRASTERSDDLGLNACSTCGAPTTAEECAFCRLRARAAGAEPVPVRPPRRKKVRS